VRQRTEAPFATRAERDNINDLCAKAYRARSVFGVKGIVWRRFSHRRMQGRGLRNHDDHPHHRVVADWRRVRAHSWLRVQKKPKYTVRNLQRRGASMNITLSLGPLVSLIAGILILVVPRLLNYIVAVYLIVIGLIGLFGGNINF
jgi:hypothetical protein